MKCLCRIRGRAKCLDPKWSDDGEFTCRASETIRKAAIRACSPTKATIDAMGDTPTPDGMASVITFDPVEFFEGCTDNVSVKLGPPKP